MRFTRTQGLAAGAALALAAAVALPAAAQSAYDDHYVAYDSEVAPVVVMGHPGPNGPSRLSQAVSYADLDLTTYQGRDVLKLRVRDTAHRLCRALGEGNDISGPLLPSCEDQAYRDARPQIRWAIDHAYARAEYAARY
jgi:UrcA family protein